jgi:uncharacterized membrane protein
MLGKLKERLKNPKVLTAIFTCILVILLKLELIDTELYEKLTEIVNVIFGL